MNKEIWVEVDSMELPNLFIGTDKFGKTMYLQKQVLPDKPKVRLEDLVACAREAFDQSKADNELERWNEVIKSICAHLGIEVEEEKPEWEKAYKECSDKLPAEITAKQLAKHMFEAGQACERRKGEK